LRLGAKKHYFFPQCFKFFAPKGDKEMHQGAKMHAESRYRSVFERKTPTWTCRGFFAFLTLKNQPCIDMQRAPLMSVIRLNDLLLVSGNCGTHNYCPSASDTSNNLHSPLQGRTWLFCPRTPAALPYAGADIF
jgi:hypothetical protein